MTQGARITQDSENFKKATCPPALMEKRLMSGIYRMESDGLYKRCSKCRDYWPADSEFFYPMNKRDGLFDWCKACYKEWRSNNYKEKTE